MKIGHVLQVYQHFSTEWSPVATTAMHNFVTLQDAYVSKLSEKFSSSSTSYCYFDPFNATTTMNFFTHLHLRFFSPPLWPFPCPLWWYLSGPLWWSVLTCGPSLALCRGPSLVPPHGPSPAPHDPFLALCCGPSLVLPRSWSLLVVVVLPGGCGPSSQSWCGPGPSWSWPCFVDLDLDLTSSSISLFLIPLLLPFAVVLHMYTYHFFD